MWAEAGLRVLPIRLVGVVSTAVDTLTLAFRCVQKGGTPHPERTAFVRFGQWPQPFVDHHAYLLTMAGKHAGGTPVWESLTPENVVQKLWHTWRGVPATTGVAWAWEGGLLLTTAVGELITLTQHGQVLLPGGSVHSRELPWRTAVRIAQEQLNLSFIPDHLTALYVMADQPQVAFVFTAVVDNAYLRQLPPHVTLLNPHQSPANLPAHHQQALRDLLSGERETVCRLLEP